MMAGVTTCGGNGEIAARIASAYLLSGFRSAESVTNSPSGSRDGLAEIPAIMRASRTRRKLNQAEGRCCAAVR